MKFLKLIDCKDDEKTQDETYVNFSIVREFFRTPGSEYTLLVMSDGWSLYVLETPEQIMELLNA